MKILKLSVKINFMHSIFNENEFGDSSLEKVGQCHVATHMCDIKDRGSETR